MPQYFLLSAEARNLSPIAITRMIEYEAVMVMKELRWGEGANLIRCYQAWFTWMLLMYILVKSPRIKRVSVLIDA